MAWADFSGSVRSSGRKVLRPRARAVSGISWKSPLAPDGLRAAGFRVDSASAIHASSGGTPSAVNAARRTGMSSAAPAGTGRPRSRASQRS